jgi:acyl-CoA reductase-like NAD-dependent aldehyde dehydrogenase
MRKTQLILGPNDGQQIAQIELMAPQEVATLCAQLSQSQLHFEKTPHSTRATWLRAVVAKIRQEAEVLAQLIATEGGKPLKDARVEVTRAAQTFDLCAEEALSLAAESGKTTLQGKQLYTFREPIGPVLVLSAFNHPLNLLAHQVGSALAAGCVVVFKPSQSTPLCGEWLLKTLREIGVPADVVMLCHAAVPEIQALVARPEFQFVSFIGSAKVGWDLRTRLAPGTRLALEHGGQAPAIVWDDADLTKAIPALLKSAFYHAGQVCISTQKIYVHQNIWEKFYQAFVNGARKLVVGDARHEDTDIGPLIRPAEKVRLQEWLSEARGLGAKILLEDSQDRGVHYMGPTILSEVSHTAKIWHEEAFGPVVCLEVFSETASIWQELRENPFQFEAAIFTQDPARIEEGIKNISAMTVVVNDHTAWRVDAMPFGGHRQSGLGMGGVRYSVEEQTRLKQIILPG